MQVTIRRMGNSQGVLIPKPLLKQVGLEGQAEMAVEGDALVLRPARPEVRSGWAEASRRIAAAGEDALALPDFQNGEDKNWTW
jgi:antitoxin MazE